jgi:hypothetical protein
MVMRAFAVAAAILIGAGSVTLALDHSTRDTTPRHPTESCCVAIPPLPPLETSAAADSQALIDFSQAARASDMKPGLDGADWNCRRPDGSQRCVSQNVTPR